MPTTKEQAIDEEVTKLYKLLSSLYGAEEVTANWQDDYAACECISDNLWGVLDTLTSYFGMQRFTERVRVCPSALTVGRFYIIVTAYTTV
jgi:hypothetical protein